MGARRDERENNQINKTAAAAAPGSAKSFVALRLRRLFFPHTQFLFFSLFKVGIDHAKETRVQSVKMTSIVFLLSHHQEIGWEERDDNAVMHHNSHEIITYHLLNQIPQVCRLISFLHRLSRDSAEIFLVVFQHFLWISRDNRRGQWTGNFADIYDGRD